MAAYRNVLRYGAIFAHTYTHTHLETKYVTMGLMDSHYAEYWVMQYLYYSPFIHMYVGVVDGLVYMYADKFERIHTQSHPNIMANINRRAARL